jgi:spore coat protein A
MPISLVRNTHGTEHFPSITVLGQAVVVSGRNLSRRGFLTTAAAGIAGLAVASCTGKNHDDALGAITDGSQGAGAPGVLNFGIPTISSQLPLPAPFQVPLPVPVRLTPRKTADTDYYEIVQSVATAEIIPGMKTTVWGYNGTFPGPTIVSTTGRRTVVNHRNELPVPTVVHLHGGQAPAGQDGYTTDYLLPAGMTAAEAGPGMPGMPEMKMADPEAHVTRLSRDYTYPMQQRAATLWYHDHRMGFTGASVNRGLAGFHIVHDDEELALPLPTGDRDIPLMICDRAFAADGSFLYPSLDPTMKKTPGVDFESMKGVMGDVILVNGAPWPALKVGAGRYRFRILNASNARVYELALRTGSGSAAFTQIGTDGGLLSAPIQQSTLVVAPAQRFDVVIDFGKFKVGEQVTLVNQADTGSVASVMRFTVDHTMNDTTSVPANLSTVDTIDPATVATRRTMDFRYGRGSQSWEINGRGFDPQTSEATVKSGATELWTITSDNHHPVHLHSATMQVVTRNGQPPGPFDQGWKDTVLIGPKNTVQVAVRFTGSPGRYMFHCHNLEHEDMAMMANYRIAD